jgi:hypothetical protein
MVFKAIGARKQMENSLLLAFIGNQLFFFGLLLVYVFLLAMMLSLFVIKTAATQMTESSWQLMDTYSASLFEQTNNFLF